MTASPTTKRAIPRWQRVVFACTLVFLPFYLYLAWLNGSFGHDGPSRMISLGVTRFESCTYKGSFVGGAGYDCVVKNFSPDDPRDQEQMSCAGFDKDNRMVRSIDGVLDLRNTVMRPGEERIVRVYAPEASATLVCAEVGDVGSPADVQKVKADFVKSGFISEFRI